MKNKIFINLSNHPSGLWKKHQKQAAQQWGDLIDLPFPNIDPAATRAALEELIGTYVDKCLQLAVKREADIGAVHLMGEMTFTFALVQALKERGLLVVASTTERISTVDEQGNKLTKFNFVRFREY